MNYGGIQKLYDAGLNMAPATKKGTVAFLSLLVFLLAGCQTNPFTCV